MALPPLIVVPLDQHFARSGYRPTANTLCLYRHDTKDIFFTLDVDDFLAKFSKREDANHFIATLKSAYSITEDWSASNYLGMTNRADKSITISMPGYINGALKRFGVTQSTQPTLAPDKYTPPILGVRTSD
jgi:hypothetical protein